MIPSEVRRVAACVLRLVEFLALVVQHRDGYNGPVGPNTRRGDQVARKLQVYRRTSRRYRLALLDETWATLERLGNDQRWPMEPEDMIAHLLDEWAVKAKEGNYREIPTL